MGSTRALLTVQNGLICNIVTHLPHTESNAPIHILHTSTVAANEISLERFRVTQIDANDAMACCLTGIVEYLRIV